MRGLRLAKEDLEKQIERVEQRLGQIEKAVKDPNLQLTDVQDLSLETDLLINKQKKLVEHKDNIDFATKKIGKVKDIRKESMEEYFYSLKGLRDEIVENTIITGNAVDELEKELAYLESQISPNIYSTPPHVITIASGTQFNVFKDEDGKWKIVEGSGFGLECDQERFDYAEWESGEACRGSLVVDLVLLDKVLRFKDYNLRDKDNKLVGWQLEF